MSRKREKCRGVSHLFGRTDSLFKDLKSKNLCSFAQPRVSEELSDWQNVFAIPTFRFFEVLFHISYYYWAKATRSLYRGLRYIEVRYIDVLLYTCQPHLHPSTSFRTPGPSVYAEYQYWYICELGKG